MQPEGGAPNSRPGRDVGFSERPAGWLPPIPDHTLLQLIATGAYGEVWLARSTLGTLRAVKIVRKQRFEEARPYVREFEGLQQFEPVSRRHIGLVDVLQAGENKAEGYFYYVMELADNAAEPSASHASTTDESTCREFPAGYAPKTLEQQITARGRLPIEECVALGIAMCDALDYLHQHGLVHRDVKPSNILFVGGVPKLADAGLVTMTRADLTNVGTSGFIPGADPGTPAADVYSLGKVLYEAATGKDRHEYPVPLTALGAEKKAWVEFNEVLLKACDEDPRRRYANAAEMQAELLMLQRGVSLHSTRRTKRVLASLKWAVLGTGLVLLLTIGALLWKNAQARRLSVLAEAHRQSRVRLNVVNGVRLLDERDWLGSLVWFAEALKQARTPREEKIHRYRLGGVLHQCPTLVQLGWHQSAINHLAFSPDGTRLLTTSDDATVCVWDTATGEKKAAFAGHSQPSSHASFSPDGQKVVSASDDGTACVWEACSGKLLVPPLSHKDSVASACFSPDGQTIVTACADGAARIWDAATGKLICPPLPHRDAVNFACFSPDGKWVATASADGTAHLWNTTNGLPIGPALRHEDEVAWVEFSPDSQQLVTAGDDCTARVWTVPEGHLAFAPLHHESLVRYACFSPDGRHVLTMGGAHRTSGEARVWDARTGKPLFPSLHFAVHVSHGTFSPDGQWFAVACSDHTARIYETRTGRPVGPILRRNRPVWVVHFSPDGRYLALGGWEHDWRMWDVSKVLLNQLPRLRALRKRQLYWGTNAWATLMKLLDPRWPFRPVECISPDGSRVLVLRKSDGRKQVFDIIDARTGQRLTEPVTQPGNLLFATFGPAGRVLVTAGSDGTARLWDAATGRRLSEPLMHHYAVQIAALSPDGTRLATGAGDPKHARPGEARIWSVPDGKPLTPWLNTTGAVVCVVFSPSGRFIATALSDDSIQPRSVRLWDAHTGQPYASTLRHEDGVSWACFSPNDCWLATGTDSGEAWVWEVATGRVVAGPMRHRRGVLCEAFSRDGLRLATGSADGSARVWDPTTGQPLTPFLEMHEGVYSTGFSPDGDRLMAYRLGVATQIFDVSADRHPVEDIEKLAWLLAGARVDEQTRRQELGPQALLALRRELQTAYPDLFRSSPEAIAHWHDQMAQAWEIRREWFAAWVHLKAWESLGINDPNVEQRLARVRAALAKHNQLAESRAAAGR